MSNKSLKRELGLGSAVMLGLGSMVGAGVFVSLGLGAGLVGPAVLAAIVLAGGLAMCNGMSSAQLAAYHPVAGGTYEYGHRVGWPALGTVAGFMFLVAKSASCATAALGLAGYVLHRFDAPQLMIPGALAVIVMLTVMVLEGIRRTNTINTIVVTITLIGLAVFVLGGIGKVDGENFSPWIYVEGGDLINVNHASWPNFAYATALMFVAYTGYGRIATMGEEIKEPRKSIPRAIVATVMVCIVVYTSVAAVGIGLVSAEGFTLLSESGAPLEAIVENVGLPVWIGWAVTIAAVTAMLGVILNLILGLSRVALAMGRRGHLPKLFVKIDDAGTTPGPAVILVALIVAGLACLGSIKAAWSLSAVTVLVYYAITNASALRLPPEARLYPRMFSWMGLLGCLGLSVFVEPIYWAFAGGVILAALVWHVISTKNNPPAE
ncbi:APC family permease [Algisphaera agarilytica]|uniref:APA family basic amino acid/polyamine antiporter n=1 Tax=Algisphaera agarilytica TaxID=1385975 RepID=A0A7X0H7R9_9BACT|nr:APC family permease [Algisphaera agarilytica]MBB6430612.1 APA family basic amino acid/polyamine antiporter [Algisphaera agarilytica]